MKKLLFVVLACLLSGCTQRLPSQQSDKITGSAALNVWTGMFTVDLYNGSDYTVKELTILITKEGPDETEVWSREYISRETIPAKSSKVIEFNVTDLSGADEFSWTILRARGSSF